MSYVYFSFNLASLLVSIFKFPRDENNFLVKYKTTNGFLHFFHACSIFQRFVSKNRMMSNFYKKIFYEALFCYQARERHVHMLKRNLANQDLSVNLNTPRTNVQ